MTLTPLAPLQGPQPQAVGTLPGIPAPMQPVAASPAPQAALPVVSQPWLADVQSNFQAAHGTFDPLAAGLATGEIGVPHPGVAGWAIGVVPQDPPGGGTTQDNGGGGNWQPGPNSTPYNNGNDQGPQTASPAPAADTGGASPTTLGNGGPSDPGVTPAQAVPNPVTGLLPPTADNPYGFSNGGAGGGYNSTGPDYYQGGGGDD